MSKTTQELIAQFKDMPFGTILINKYTGIRFCFIGDPAYFLKMGTCVQVVEEGSSRVSKYYFEGFHDFALVTEGEYAEIVKQKQEKQEKDKFFKLYPIGTPVVAVRTSGITQGTVYCFVVDGHDTCYLSLFGGGGIFPKKDYKFYAVTGDEFQLCLESEN